MPKPLFAARLLSAHNIALLAGVMLLFWAPFWSGHRLPVFILLCVGIYVHARSRQWLPSGGAERRWGAILLLLLIPCLLATPNSYSFRASMTLSLALALHYWVGIGLLHGMRQGGHVQAAKWIGLTLLFWTLDGGVQFIFGRDLLGVPLPSGEMRVLGPFNGNLHMGLFICTLMPLLLWPLAKTRPWMAMALFIPMGAIAALAGARTNMVFVLLVAIALTFRLPTWKHRIALLLLSLSPALVIPLSPVLQSRMQVSATALSNETGQIEQSLFEKLDTISSGRMILWESAGNMLLKHPLTGVGPSAFDRAYPNFVTRANDPFRHRNAEGKYAYHAHQMYIGVAAETGLIGLAGLLICIGLIVRWYRQAGAAARAAANPYAVSLAIIAFPINSQPVLYAGWWFPIVLLLLCGLLAALEDVPTASDE